MMDAREWLSMMGRMGGFGVPACPIRLPVVKAS